MALGRFDGDLDDDNGVDHNDNKNCVLDDNYIVGYGYDDDDDDVVVVVVVVVEEDDDVVFVVDDDDDV